MIELTCHPLATRIPEMLLDERVELERDIKANGLRQPILLYDGQILDGRHRYAICTKLDIEPKVETFTGTEAEAKALVLSLNVHRRHLSFEQKQQFIEAELQREPTQSDRAIAAKINASPTSVGKVRAKAAAAGQLSTVDSSKRTGKDGKARKQPVKNVIPKVVTPAARPDTLPPSPGTASAWWPRKSGPVAIAQAILDALGDATRAASVGRQLERLARKSLLADIAGGAT